MLSITKLYGQTHPVTGEKKDFVVIVDDGQRQDALNDQLKDLAGIANSIGCYDASDFLRNILEKQ